MQVLVKSLWKSTFSNSAWKHLANFSKTSPSVFYKGWSWSLAAKCKSLSGAFRNQLFRIRLGSTWPTFPKWLQAYSIRLDLGACLQNAGPCQEPLEINFFPFGLETLFQNAPSTFYAAGSWSLAWIEFATCCSLYNGRNNPGWRRQGSLTSPNHLQIKVNFYFLGVILHGRSNPGLISPPLKHTPKTPAFQHFSHPQKQG